MFDNSDYPSDSSYYFRNNTKVIGKMKDEAAGCPIAKFVGLLIKMYSYIKDGKGGGRTIKGVKKSAVKKVIKHENYKDVLFISQQLHYTMKTIRSVNYQLRSYEVCHASTTRGIF